MRTVILAVATLAMATSAQADRITDACERVAEHYFFVDDVYLDGTQSFPDLDPPRVNIRIKPSESSTMDFTIKCRFESPESPLNISEYCVDGNCSSEGTNAERFEEIKHLLEKDGF